MNRFFIVLLGIIACLGKKESTNQWIDITETINSNYSSFYNQIIDSHRLTFYIALKQNVNGIKQLESYILNHLSNIDSELYGHYLTPFQIMKFTAPEKYNVDQVINWLIDNNVVYEFMGDSFKCIAPVNKINELFNVQMHLYQNLITDKVKFRSINDYVIPKEILSYIDFIDGISNPLYPGNGKKINVGQKDNSDVSKGSFSLEVMKRLYNMNDYGKNTLFDTDFLCEYGICFTVNNYNCSLGAMEFDQFCGFSNRDLLVGQTANGVKKNPITKDHIIGTKESPDTESELDVQVMYWAKPDATLWYEVSDNWIYSWAVDFVNRVDVPEVVSLSWGYSERDQCSITKCNNITSQQYIARCNIELMKLAARGITVVVSSGDAGSPGRTNENCDSSQDSDGFWSNINADFPGCSPWVLSVGATYLITSNNSFNYTTPICTDYLSHNITCSNGVSEAGIYFNKTYWTTGGSFTHWDSRPVWQEANVDAYLKSGVVLPENKFFNYSNRAYPDVTAVGHNCIIKAEGSWQNVDGTSCSAPVFAGIIAHLNSVQKQINKPVLGFVNPLLYKMHHDDPSTFNDITDGTTQCTESTCCDDNFGFRSTTGWDPVSGLGSPNIGKMVEYLMHN